MQALVLLMMVEVVVLIGLLHFRATRAGGRTGLAYLIGGAGATLATVLVLFINFTPLRGLSAGEIFAVHVGALPLIGEAAYGGGKGLAACRLYQAFYWFLVFYCCLMIVLWHVPYISPWMVTLQVGMMAVVVGHHRLIERRARALKAAAVAFGDSTD